MDNLTPITREEMLMNDEPLTPITREEKILAGEDLTPVTRREYFLKKYRHAGGDVMVEGLSVTENGTYTAPEGKAYSPVEVNVPMPENAYLLKTASGSLVSFSDGADLPIPSFICNIDAQQDLHGYDHPWVGGAGKNKWEFDSSLSGNGNVLSGKVFTYQIPSDTYTLSCKGTFASGGAMAFRFVYTDNTTKDVTLGYNVQSGTYYVSAVFEKAVKALSYVYSNNANNNINSIQLESGSTATSYEPYSNICPISGHTGLDAWVRGKNQLPMTVESIKAANTSGTWSGNSYTKNNVVFTLNTDRDGNITSIMVNGTNNSSTDSVYFKLASDITTILFDGTYTVSGCIGGTFGTYSLQVYARGGSAGNNFVGNFAGDTSIFKDGLQSYYVSSVYITIRPNAAMSNVLFYPMIRLADQSAEYEPYNPQSQTIQVSWQTEAGEVFGGYVDLVSGVLTVTDGYIASYNGETLPSTWISDRDTYAEGTSPTTGAEVVYKLANPQTYQLDGNQIKSLLGNNNAWCSTGDVDIDYFAKEV